MYLYIPSNSAQASACSEKGSAPHSDFLASATAPFFTWNGKLQPPPSLSRLWKREPLIRRLSGLTCSPSMAERGAALWISSLRDSRAKTSASPAGVQVLTARGLGSSSTSWTSRTIATRQDSFWRTSQASLLPPPPLWTKPRASLKSAQPPVSWENWPTVGGMRSGSLFQHPTWAPAMGVHAGSVLLGEWLTPNVPNGGRSVSSEVVATKGMTEAGKRTVGLESQTRHWMTPSVSNSQGNEYTRDRGRPGQERLTLTGQAQQWPTPRGTDGTKGGPNQAGSKGDLMLPSAAAQWPTPASRDWKGANSVEHITTNGTGRMHMDQLPNFVEHQFYSHPVHSTLDGRPLSPTGRTLPRRLNPAFGCWLMGWPIWWTNPGLTNCVRSETESWRSALQQQLCSFFAEPESAEMAANFAHERQTYGRAAA